MSVLIMAPPSYVRVGHMWFWMAFNFETQQWVSETFIQLAAGTRYLRKSYSENPTIIQRMEDAARDGRTLKRPFTVSQVAVPGGDTACVISLFVDWCSAGRDTSYRDVVQLIDPEQQLPMQVFELLQQQGLDEGVTRPGDWGAFTYVLAQRLREINYFALADIVEEHAPRNSST